MTPNDVYNLANNIMVVLWLFLLASLWIPALRRWALSAGFWVMPTLLGLAYVYYLVPAMLESSGSFSTLESVGALFDNDRLLLAGWLHYLVFDFFIGAWIVRTTLDENLPRALTTICLPFAFLAGPLGLLLFVILRGVAAARRQDDPA